MYLVHVRVLLPAGPFDTEVVRDWFRSHVLPEERVEHVSVHGTGDDTLTVGFFVQAAGLLAAEDIALGVTRRAVSHEPELLPARIAHCSGALVADFYDRMFDFPAHDGRTMRVQDQDTDLD
jgi:hypothetical protein